MSDNFDALWMSAMEHSLHTFDACSHFRANLDTHDMRALCRAHAGDSVYYRRQLYHMYIMG